MKIDKKATFEGGRIVQDFMGIRKNTGKGYTMVVDYNGKVLILIRRQFAAKHYQNTDTRGSYERLPNLCAIFHLCCKSHTSPEQFPNRLSQ